MTTLGIQPIWRIVGLFALCLIGFGSCQSLTVSPKPFHSLVDEQLTITCKTDGNAFEYRRVEDIQIKKDGKVLSHVLANQTILQPFYSPNVKTTGLIDDGDASQSYLIVVIEHPEMADAGDYLCSVAYMGGEPELQWAETRVEATAVEPAIRLEATPNPFHLLIDNVLSLTCSVASDNDWVQKVISLEIQRVGQKPIAAVNLRDGVYITGGGQNMEATGYIDKNVSRCFLTVTIKNPAQADLNTYSCRMNYMDENELKQEKVFSDIIIDNANLTTMLTYLTKKVSDLSQSAKRRDDIISKQDEQLEAMKDGISSQKDTIHSLNRQIESQNKDISVLKNTISTQKEITASHDRLIVAIGKEIKSLSKKESVQCAFSVRYDKSQKLKDEHPLIFSNARINVGNAFNTNTGVFTAPTNGVYVLHLSVRTSDRKDYISIELRINKGDKWAVSLHARDDDDYFGDQSAGLSITELQAGDIVDVYVWGYEGSNTLASHGSEFSGFLLYTLP